MVLKGSKENQPVIWPRLPEVSGGGSVQLTVVVETVMQEPCCAPNVFAVCANIVVRCCGYLGVPAHLQLHSG